MTLQPCVYVYVCARRRVDEGNVELRQSACDSLATFHRFDSYRRLLWQHAILIRKRVQLKMAVQEPMALPMRLRNQLQSVYELDPLRNEVSFTFPLVYPKKLRYWNWIECLVEHYQRRGTGTAVKRSHGQRSGLARRCRGCVGHRTSPQCDREKEPLKRSHILFFMANICCLWMK